MNVIDKILWFFANADAHRIVAPLVLPIAVGLLVYQSHYPYVLLRTLWQRIFGDGFVPLTKADAPSLGMTMPTLLRNREDLDGLRTGLASAIASNYPGRLTIIAVIDGLDVAPDLVRELRAWAAAQTIPENVVLEITGSGKRVGKAFAGDLGVQRLVALAREGVIPEKPPIYFNMDADCELGPMALDRMVRALMRKSIFTGQPGTIVTSHVSIKEHEYFRGWRELFTVKGQLRIAVAREYLVAIGLGRHNVLRVLPQNGASGALYCTWIEIVEWAPHWARFLGELRAKDWLGWWIGNAPPHFDPEKIAPLPEAMTGMGEDTWLSWLACAARFENGKLTVELPRTPAHALWHAFLGYLARPFRYDPRAKIYTTTPTSLKGLFLQRIRWNVSRIWTVQCWNFGLLYHLNIGIPALIDVVLATAFQAIVVVGLVLAPFAGPTSAMAPALFLLVELGYAVERTIGTSIAMLLDSGEKGQWKKVLGLPIAGIFHMVFNVATTIGGFGMQVFGNGYNDRFAPEETMIRGGTSRIALTYRVRRFLSLCVRSIVRGDVPLGWFWFGWGETPWTPNGYQGWTTGIIPPVVHATPDVATTPAVDPAPSMVELVKAAVTEMSDEADDLPDSGVRPRPVAAPAAVRDRASMA